MYTNPRSNRNLLEKDNAIVCDKRSENRKNFRSRLLFTPLSRLIKLLHDYDRQLYSAIVTTSYD